MVLDVDPSGRRIRLSRKAIPEAAAREETREYQERENTRESGGFGSLAETLRKAIENGK
jgi:ribosomal protein S1